MARTLYLHIGSHKTGTTSIQGWLSKHGDLLKARGYVYPIGSNGLNLGGVTGGIDEAGDEDDGLMLARRTQGAIQLIKAGEEPNVIASSEGFSYLNDPTEIKALARRLRRSFATIKVITYLRRQDLFAVSHHQEGANPQMKPAAKLHGHRPTALPEASELQRKYLDYETRIGMWGDAFGDRNVIVRVYDRALLKDGDSVRDFLDLVGLGDIEIEKAVTRNTSMGFVRTKLGHILHQHVHDQATRARLMKRLPNEGKLLPSRDAARAFLAPYVEGNRRLNKRFRIADSRDLFSDDFQAYPEAGQELWDEETATVALAACLQLIEEMRSRAAAFETADYAAAGDALAKTQPELAQKFMAAAMGLPVTAAAEDAPKGGAKGKRQRKAGGKAGKKAGGAKAGAGRRTGGKRLAKAGASALGQA